MARRRTQGSYGTTTKVHFLGPTGREQVQQQTLQKYRESTARQKHRHQEAGAIQPQHSYAHNHTHSNEHRLADNYNRPRAYEYDQIHGHGNGQNQGNNPGHNHTSHRRQDFGHNQGHRGNHAKYHDHHNPHGNDESYRQMEQRSAMVGREQMDKIPKALKPDSSWENSSQERYTRHLGKRLHHAPLISKHTRDQYSLLAETLAQQSKRCEMYAKRFEYMGNTAESSRLSLLGKDSLRLLHWLKQAQDLGQPVPEHGFLDDTFNIIKVFPNMSKSDLILTVVSATDLQPPSGVSAATINPFVKIEFPFPSAAEPQRAKTNVMKNTCAPEFNESFKLSIDRTARDLRYRIQSSAIVFEIYHKSHCRAGGTLFRGDRLLGTARLPLAQLESECDLVDSLPFLKDAHGPKGMKERHPKQLYAKLLVRVRIREPLRGLEVQRLVERWLYLDAIQLQILFQGLKLNLKPVIYSMASVEVLRFDKKLLDKELATYVQKARVLPESLLAHSLELGQRLEWQCTRLECATAAFMQEYQDYLKELLRKYTDEVYKLQRFGDREQVEIFLLKKQLVEKEIAEHGRSR
uniref:coiled-coil and C2 domain-containing protein 1A-like isoform X2 n=1 Tax=Myxine glutinosa TaxID=7769 RepID=UPI00358E7E9A